MAVYVGRSLSSASLTPPQVLAEYDDKDGSRARAILEKAEQSKRNLKAEDDEGVDKGHSVLSTDQSAITGESLAVDKFIGDTVYYTTNCKRGRCYVLVTDIAKQTFVGRTAALVLGSNEKGHFQVCRSNRGRLR